jgi:RnfABCDGE-type electron transport complex B subunit
MSNLIELINAELPQYQCGRCDTPGCKPYAISIAEGAPHNRCVPGGQQTLDNISAIIDRDSTTIDDGYGPALTDQIANIVEEDCIGCTKCIDACPVDAIVGAANLMHSVIEDMCTGCELCIEPCPVDCIDLIPVNIRESKNARNKSEQFFNLKNFLNDRKINNSKLSRNIKLNLDIANSINSKISKRSIDKNISLQNLQIDILEKSKKEKNADLDHIDQLISKIKL